MNWSVFCVVLFVAVGVAQPPPSLGAYLAQHEGEAQWAVAATQDLGLAKLTEIRLVSQVWRGIPWHHRIMLAEPHRPEFGDVVILYVSGDRSALDSSLALAAAMEAGMPMAVLSDVPNQPLFGRREDALIAYTFERYAESGETDWPLLFPMTRSALAAMEAITSCMRESGRDVRGFVVTGASKRGWTSYLAAAARPDVVIGLVPMVYEALDMASHIAHQLAFWGKTSRMIEDYQPLFGFLETPEGQALAQAVDPYAYRHRLTMPKLVVVGSNDPYWPVNSANLYWGELPEPKGLARLANAGHSLGDWIRVARIVATFARLVAAGQPLPRVEAEFVGEPQGLRVIVRTTQAPAAVRLWVASDQVQDFRGALWTASPLPPASPAEALVPWPASGYRAVYAEVIFDQGGRELALATGVAVLAPR